MIPTTDYTEEFEYIQADMLHEPEGIYEANRDLNTARRIIEETGENLFLTGKAGTGKTTFLQRLQQTSSKRMVVLAPTGVAAINAGGTTIHSFFQLSFSPYIPGKGFVEKESRHFNFSKEKRRIIASLDLLVIDEISMVRPDTLDAIDNVLRRFRNPSLPFGGVQLLLIGDLRQLAPVMKENERQLLEPYYPSEYFFESQALRESGFVTIELHTVYRQNDPDFINILNAIRDGKLTQLILKRLNERVIPDFSPDEDQRYIRLTTHNRLADEINYSRLHYLPEETRIFEAEIKGHFPETSFPAESTLRLKTGAQVMFIKNDTGYNRRYYNGMLGTITGFDSDCIIVSPADGQPPITVSRVEWENTKYVINNDSKEIVPVTDGTFTQFPLRLAWAITIHKSQGLTFERAVIDAEASFAPGQTYVALSRCRSLKGLVLSKPVPVSAVITDSKVNTFIEESNKNRPDSKAIDRMRAEYTRSTLADLFNFRTLRIAFDDYHRALTEYVIPLYPEYFQPFREAAEIISGKVDLIGSKFTALYATSPVLPENLKKHPDFLLKIKNGCSYFISHLDSVIATVNSVNVKIDNASYVSRLTNTYEAILFQLKVKQSVLQQLSTVDFSPSSYVEAKARAVIDATRENKTTLKVTKGNRKERKENEESKNKNPRQPRGYSKRISYTLCLEGKSIEEIAAERNLVPSTVASHLGEFILTGELKPEQAFSPTELRILKEEFGKDSELKEIFNELTGRVADYKVSLYYRSIYKPSTESDQT